VSQSSDRGQLKNDLKASWPALLETVRSALETLETYIEKSVRDGGDGGEKVPR
jgi:hypothetical protein